MQLLPSLPGYCPAPPPVLCSIFACKRQPHKNALKAADTIALGEEVGCGCWHRYRIGTQLRQDAHPQKAAPSPCLKLLPDQTRPLAPRGRSRVLAEAGQSPSEAPRGFPAASGAPSGGPFWNCTSLFPRGQHSLLSPARRAVGPPLE